MDPVVGSLNTNFVSEQILAWLKSEGFNRKIKTDFQKVPFRMLTLDGKRPSQPITSPPARPPGVAKTYASLSRLTLYPITSMSLVLQNQFPRHMIYRTAVCVFACILGLS